MHNIVHYEDGTVLAAPFAECPAQLGHTPVSVQGSRIDKTLDKLCIKAIAPGETGAAHANLYRMTFAVHSPSLARALIYIFISINSSGYESDKKYDTGAS
jgi:hypothetical protein